MSESPRPARSFLRRLSRSQTFVAVLIDMTFCHLNGGSAIIVRRDQLVQLADAGFGLILSRRRGSVESHRRVIHDTAVTRALRI